MATAREMNNLLLLWDDAVTQIDGVTIEAASAAVSGFAAANLLDTSRQTCLKFSGSGDDIHVGFDLGAAYTIKGFGLHNHSIATADVSVMDIRYDAATYAGSTPYGVTFGPAETGDDDFVCMFSAGISSRYWWFGFDSVASAALYIGRIFLARQAYDYTEGILSPGLKGYMHVEDILETKGGIEHRISRGSLRKRMTFMLPPLTSDPARAQIVSLIEHVELNHRAFVTSWPYATTEYTGISRYGLGVHARFVDAEWTYECLVAGKSRIPLNLVEVL